VGEKMNEYQDAEQLNELQADMMEKMFDAWAREKRLTQQKVAIVATGGVADATATVYFPPDVSTASSPFKNKTGRTLIANEKVYVLLKYGESDQGWIID
jgi:hypothetical protein